MLKLVGAVLVLSAAVWCGVSAAARLRERAEVLECLERSLCFLEEELAFSHKPLPQLLERLGDTLEGDVGRFYGQVCAALTAGPENGLRRCWRQGIETNLSHLHAEEWDVLMELGDTLGRYDAQTQIQALHRASGRLAQLRADARKDVPRLGRVYTALGVSGGLLAVLILL